MRRPFLSSRRRRPLYLLLGVAALAATVAAGLVAEVALGPHPRENFKLPPVPPLPGGRTPARAAGPQSRPAGGPLQVIEGRHLEPAGIRVGFPHTQAGAVSAAVEDWSQIGSDLNPARAAAIGREIAVRAWRSGPAALAAGVRRTRAGLGLAAAGPVPAGAHVTFTAVAYQVRRAGRSQLTVLLLAYYTTTVPGQQPQTRIGVYPANMRWERGDWKIAAPGRADYSGLDAQPGSSRAAAAGWQPLNQ